MGKGSYEIWEGLIRIGFVEEQCLQFGVKELWRAEQKQRERFRDIVKEREREGDTVKQNNRE